ncbi:hypothetical protein ACLKA6_002731 [Drosophila palustris]
MLCFDNESSSPLHLKYYAAAETRYPDSSRLEATAIPARVAHTAERVARKLILQDENVYAGAGRFDVAGHVSCASSGSRADEAEDNDDDKGNNQAY